MGSIVHIRVAQLHYQDLMTEVAQEKRVAQAAGTKRSHRSLHSAFDAICRVVTVVMVGALARH